MRPGPAFSAAGTRNSLSIREFCYTDNMSKFTERAAAALELLPEELQESTVAYILEQAEKFRALKADLQVGLDDEVAGRVRPWNFEDFLRRARELNT